MKVYAIMAYNKLHTYIINNQILNIHQYASKQASGAEDCIRDMVNDINQMQHQQFPVTFYTKDASDAYNNMKTEIINDKFQFHIGLNEKA